jgi:hypothetical protein
MDPTVTCPQCKAEIKLTESLAAPLVEATRRQYEQMLADRESQFARRDAELRSQQAALAKQREEFEETLAAKLKTEREAIAAEEARKARQLLTADLDGKTKQLAELEQVLKERDEKLAQAQAAQADLLRKARELDDARRELELTVEKQVQNQLDAVRQKASLAAQEEYKLKLAERDHLVATLQKQMEEMQRRAEQGSQQLQGEVQELALEQLLRREFPLDAILPVPKGQHGGDVVHQVFGTTGNLCGTILWESKRAKNWSDGWLPKLRDDQRAAKAELAVLVTQVLPKDKDHADQPRGEFALVDGVWVVAWTCAVPVAVALRYFLLENAAARTASAGQLTKMERMYQYLTGPQFRHRVEAIVEKFSDMHQDLEKERKTLTRLWAKREQQIRGVVEATAGMYGDLQGIAGQSIPEIDGLDLKLLPDDSGNGQDAA